MLPEALLHYSSLKSHHRSSLQKEIKVLYNLSLCPRTNTAWNSLTANLEKGSLCKRVKDNSPTRHPPWLHLIWWSRLLQEPPPRLGVARTLLRKALPLVTSFYPFLLSAQINIPAFTLFLIQRDRGSNNLNIRASISWALNEHPSNVGTALSFYVSEE